MSSHLIGEPETVRQGLVQLQRRTEADELMISTRMHSYEARVRSLTLVAEAWGLTPDGLDAAWGLTPDAATNGPA